MEALVNAVIRHNIEKISGGNFPTVADSILSALEIDGVINLVPVVLQESLRTVALNLQRVYNKYFVWRESSGQEPIDLYVYVYEHGDEVMGQLTLGLSDDLYDDPYSYNMRYYLEENFREFPAILLEVGYIHKFNKDFIETHIFPEDEVEED